MNAKSKILLSLRTKLVVFTSLVIVGVCSGLSWYLVRQQADSLNNSLVDHGFNLVRYLAHNSRYSLITQDTDSLRRILEGALSVEEVVYVVALDPQGHPIIALTKGELTEPGNASRSSELPLYPPTSLAQEILSTSTEGPTMTVFTTVGQDYEIISNRGKAGSVSSIFTQPGETIYDFALPIRGRPPEYSLLGPLSLEFQEGPQPQEGRTPFLRSMGSFKLVLPIRL